MDHPFQVPEQAPFTAEWFDALPEHRKAAFDPQYTAEQMRQMTIEQEEDDNYSVSPYSYVKPTS